MKPISITSFLLLMFVETAHAHPGHALDSAMAGFTHPLTGWDHLLVMLAVGVWASRFKGAGRWAMPIAFLLVMAIGMALSAVGYQFNHLELMISTSVLLLGLLLTLAIKLPTAVRVALLMLFASVHGMAHGTELANQQVALAMLGMLLATGCLHALGLVLGMQQKPIMQKLNLGLAWFMVMIGAYWTLT